MNDNLTKYGVVGNAVVTVGILLLLIFGGGKTAPAGNYLTDAGAPGQSFGAIASSFASTVFSHLSNLQVNGNFAVVGISAQGADGNTGIVLQQQATTGSCAGTASSTQFAILNPFSATSTVTMGSLSGVANAFATDFVVGTSTSPGGMTATTTLGTVAVGYIGMYNIASGAQFYTVPGFATGPKGGYQSPSGGTYTTHAEVILGPNEYLVGYATSTAVTGGIGVKSCTYKFEWQT